MVNYNGALKLSDFSEPHFRDEMVEIFPHLAAAHADFPSGHEIAKAWEVTQAVRAMRDHSVLRPDAELLGVAAGWEHTVFYLTNFVKRVFATDLYVTNESWQEADHRMLANPELFATPGLEWKPRRLVVQHMNALDLRYEDESFDGIFSCGSIEHFGSLENVAQAAREMGRVLKTGGIATLSTEFRISGPDGLGVPGAIIFTPEMIEEHVIRASGLTPVDDVDFSFTADTCELAYPLAEAVQHGVRPRSIALMHDGYTWTSIALCLRKA